MSDTENLALLALGIGIGTAAGGLVIVVAPTPFTSFVLAVFSAAACTVALLVQRASARRRDAVPVSVDDSPTLTVSWPDGRVETLPAYRLDENGRHVDGQ